MQRRMGRDWGPHTGCILCLIHTDDANATKLSRFVAWASSVRFGHYVSQRAVLAGSAVAAASERKSAKYRTVCHLAIT